MNPQVSSMADGHLTNGLLVQFIDDELSTAEAREAQSHLSQCPSCSYRYAELRKASSSVDSFIESLRPAFDVSERQELAAKLDRASGMRRSHRAVRPVRRFGWWGLAAAASLAIGVLYLPSSFPFRPETRTAQSAKETTGAFEIDGETFVSLPFSNPELPVNARRIVQMQVQVSSLAEVGIVVEPIASQVAQPDHSVLADVLLGLDGQPLAVHVVNVD
jgi:hypothetical protein